MKIDKNEARIILEMLGLVNRAYPDMQNASIAEMHNLADRARNYKSTNVVRDRYIVVTEHDMPEDRWTESGGPIAMETYIGSSNMNNVIERAENIGRRYGRLMICRLDPIGNLDQFKQYIHKPV